jgi:hypothetical protein
MITIFYRCTCMAEEAVITVPSRRETEDIIQWMDNVVAPALYLDHRGRSPKCSEATMEYLKIPLPEGTASIGEEVKLN